MGATIGNRGGNGAGAKAKGYVRTEKAAAALINFRGLLSPDSLRAWRRDFGLSVERAAELAGLHPGTWHKWEGNPRAAWWRAHPAYLRILLRGIERRLAGERERKVTPLALKRWRRLWGLGPWYASRLISHHKDTWHKWESGTHDAPSYLSTLLLGAEDELRAKGLKPGMWPVSRACKLLGLTREGVRLLIEKGTGGPFPGAVKLTPQYYLLPREEVERAAATR